MATLFRLFILIQFIITAEFAYSRGQYEGVIIPPNGDKKTSIYDIEGFDHWKTCSQFEECTAIAWPREGAKVDVYGVRRVTGGQSKSEYFFEVGYASPNGYKRGYISKSYVFTDMPVSNCESVQFSNIIGGAQDIAKIVLKGVKFDKNFLIGNKRVFSPKCKNFVDEDGAMGSWGRKVLEALMAADKPYKRKKGNSCFFQDLDVSSVCPNFRKKFDEDMKATFWTYVFASISQVESSCRPSAQAIGSNGTADGLMQLEYAQSLRRKSGRDQELCSTKKPVDSQDLDFQFRCAASIFRDYHCGYRNGKKRPLTSKSGYWERLRGTKKEISKLAKEFPGCI